MRQMARDARAVLGGFSDESQPGAVPGGADLDIGHRGDEFLVQRGVRLQRAGQDDAVGGKAAAGAAAGSKGDTVGGYPFDHRPDMNGDTQAVETVHVFGLALVAEFRRYRLAGFQHRD